MKSELVRKHERKLVLKTFDVTASKKAKWDEGVSIAEKLSSLSDNEKRCLEIADSASFVLHERSAKKRKSDHMDSAIDAVVVASSKIKRSRPTGKDLVAQSNRYGT